MPTLKKGNVIPSLEVLDMTEDGRCVARYDNIVIFVKGVAPGDIADVRITKNKKSYAEGVAQIIQRHSDKRTEPFCEHFGLCGGCKWQHVDYSTQLEFKDKTVKDAIERIGDVKDAEFESIIGSETIVEYRNKLEFTFTARRWLTNEEIKSDEELERRAAGFHVPGGFDRVINIEKCHLQDDFTNRVRNFIKDYGIENGLSFYNIRDHVGLLRNLIVRNTSIGEKMIIMQFGEPDQEHIDHVMNAVVEKFPELTSIFYVINEKKNDTIHDQELICIKGAPYITEELDGLKFRIGPKSFFQTNSNQTLQLYRKTVEYAGLTGEEVVYDIYTGTGTIANYVAPKSKKVVGVEYVPEAIEDATVNSEINNIQNTSFFAGDMKDILTNQFFTENGAPDVIITDPPRAGMHEDVVNRINESGAKKVVYVSCNASTQARDIKLMTNYKFVKGCPVDMFPHTGHVENVVLLKRR